MKNELKHTSHCRHHSQRAPNLKPYLSSLGTSQARVSAPRTISPFIFRNSPTKTLSRRRLTRRPERPRQSSTVGSKTVYGASTTQRSQTITSQKSLTRGHSQIRGARPSSTASTTRCRNDSYIFNIHPSILEHLDSRGGSTFLVA